MTFLGSGANPNPPNNVVNYVSDYSQAFSLPSIGVTDCYVRHIGTENDAHYLYQTAHPTQACLSSHIVCKLFSSYILGKTQITWVLQRNANPRNFLKFSIVRLCLYKHPLLVG